MTKGPSASEHIRVFKKAIPRLAGRTYSDQEIAAAIEELLRERVLTYLRAQTRGMIVADIKEIADELCNPHETAESAPEPISKPKPRTPRPGTAEYRKALYPDE